MVIEHQVTDETVEKILPLYSWLKACPKSSVFMPDSTQVDSMLTRKHSTIVARFIQDNMHNLTLTTPHEQVELTHWEVSPQEQKLARKPKTIVDLFANSHDNYAKCTYKREQIVTFDGQTVKIPMTQCYTILAKDCSEENTPKFALMAKKMNKRGDDLKVKFMTQKKTFELYKGESDGGMVIKADGLIVRKDEYDQYLIRKIETKENTIFEVKCPHTEAILRFDGQKIAIKISDEFMNRQCGVCGHMNNDREDDFLKHDKTQAESSSDFQLSYMYRGEECEPEALREIEDMKPKNRRRDEPEAPSSSSEERRERSPVKRTIVVEKRDKVCFSHKPEYACPEGFEIKLNDRVEKEKTKFLCKPRTEPETQRLLRKARKGETVKVEGETSEHSEKIEIPRRCTKY